MKRIITFALGSILALGIVAVGGTKFAQKQAACPECFPPPDCTPGVDCPPLAAI